MIYCRGCGKEIHETANLCPHCGAPQTANSQSIADPTNSGITKTTIWILAFAPIIGSILEGIIAYTIHNNEYAASIALNKGYYFWVTIVLNISLCIFDEQNLKKLGVDTNQFGSAFLVPVYLFKRAKALNHNPPAYFIVWIVCFTISILT